MRRARCCAMRRRPSSRRSILVDRCEASEAPAGRRSLGRPLWTVGDCAENQRSGRAACSDSPSRDPLARVRAVPPVRIAASVSRLPSESPAKTRSGGGDHIPGGQQGGYPQRFSRRCAVSVWNRRTQERDHRDLLSTGRAAAVRRASHTGRRLRISVREKSRHALVDARLRRRGSAFGGVTLVSLTGRVRRGRINCARFG